MGYYNFRVTGNAFLMPYAVHEATYNVARPFIWQSPRVEPVYNHQALRDFHVEREPAGYFKQRQSIPSYAMAQLEKGIRLWNFYLGPLLIIPLVTLGWVFRNRWMRFALLTLGVLFVALLQMTWVQPHYVAPVAALVYVVVVQGMRHLRLWRWRSWHIGRYLVRTIPMIYLARVIAVVGITALAQFVPGLQHTRADFYRHEWPYHLHRQRILTELEQKEGRHLVIVHYPPTHSPHDEWVNNEADIDGAKVVWARELDDEHNRMLLAYFKDRHVWLLNADEWSYNVAPVPLILAGNDIMNGDDATQLYRGR